MTNLRSIIQGSMEQPFSELFFLMHRCNIFWFRILTISCKIFINTVISIETTNELTIDAILCQNVTMLYRQEVAFLFQLQKNLRVCRNSK